MFRLLAILFLLVIGIYLGFQLSMYAMQSECTSLEGDWTGRVCVKTEPSQ